MSRLIFLLLLPLAVHAAGGLPDAVTPDGGRYYGSLRNGKLHGLGRIEWDSGARYDGAFQDGLYQGHGKLATSDGRFYIGDFANGLFHGRGRYELPSGEVYEGDFEKGEFTGRGTYSRADGVRYRGEFRKWRMHGEGRYVDANGDIYQGRFVEGRFAEPPPPSQNVLNVETALYTQRRLLDEALAALAPGRRGVIDLYLLAVGGDGKQEVFRREVDFVRAQFDGRFGTRSRSVALVNSRNTVAAMPMATVTSISEALKAIAARMDRDEDILFLFLTSHGSRDHELQLAQPQMTLRGLTAPELGRLLKESGIRWKVVLVSACYSGGFIDHLKDDSTLVITAARHDRTSFGCADENDFTYFGRAFFKEALPASHSFDEAFQKAAALVGAWEAKDQPKEPRSEPQIYGTVAIREHLKRWWSVVK